MEVVTCESELYPVRGELANHIEYDNNNYVHLNCGN